MPPSGRGPEDGNWTRLEALLGEIAELDLRTGGGQERPDAIESAVRLRAREARSLLEVDPSLRESFMDAVLARSIARFPYEELTKGLAHDLVVAYAFPPSSDSSGNVAARRVRQRGRPADVVSCDLQRGTDAGATIITAGFVDNHAILPGPSSYGDWIHIDAFMTTGLETVARWIKAGRTYENLYSRSMWPASHMLAAILKLRMPHLTWTAEFSDPMQRTIRGRVRYDPTPRRARHIRELRRGLKRARIPRPITDNLWEWVEHLAFALADDILFTNPNQRDFMLSALRLPELRERVAVVGRISGHPIPSEPFYTWASPEYPMDPTAVNLAYFGRFYPNRGISELLASIASSPTAVRDAVHLHVFSNEPAAVTEQIEASGLKGHVTSNGYVPYLDFLAIARGMDLLVVNDTDTRGAHSTNPYLPSKLSDYQGSGTPIWAIYEPGSALSQTSVRFRSQLGDAAEAREVLRTAAVALQGLKGTAPQ